jgi:hypothetical protein
LAKCCTTCEEKYGCKFVFCKPEESAEMIIKILQGGGDLSRNVSHLQNT